ncbi:MAG: hypothetical protein IT289_00225 [Oligoflexia bacterium]|nr:hypothetical protein [Oligoflexia bacterium]
MSELATQLISADHLEEIQKGIPTGMPNLNEALPWHGLPKNALTAFIGPQGSGRLRLWASAMSQESGFGAFIEKQKQLYPPALAQLGVDLQKLLIIRAHEDKKVLWSLGQILQSRAFGLIACQSPSTLKPSDVHRIASLSRSSGASVVFFFDRLPVDFPHWLFQLQVSFQQPNRLVIEKARVQKPDPISVDKYETAHPMSEHFKQYRLLGKCG